MAITEKLKCHPAHIRQHFIGSLLFSDIKQTLHSIIVISRIVALNEIGILYFAMLQNVEYRL